MKDEEIIIAVKWGDDHNWWKNKGYVIKDEKIVEWRGSKPKPTEQQLKDAYNEWKKEYEKKQEYKDKRVEDEDKLGSLAERVDALWAYIIDPEDPDGKEMKKEIDKIHKKHPKPKAIKKSKGRGPK